MFCFFFLMRRSPLRSTLFPYTTLFRSLQSGCQSDVQEVSMKFALRVNGKLQSVELAPDTPLLTRKAKDRKSTRLNSSHQIISYAVFCLKKKTKTDKTHTHYNLHGQPLR